MFIGAVPRIFSLKTISVLGRKSCQTTQRSSHKAQTERCTSFFKKHSFIQKYTKHHIKNKIKYTIIKLKCIYKNSVYKNYIKI